MTIRTVLRGLRARLADLAAARHTARGRSAESRGHLEDACRHYRAALAARPGRASAHLDLGAALEALGDAAGAASAYEAARALEPGNAFANYNLGKAVFLRGETQRAAELLRAALAAQPEFPEAYVVLAQALEASGNRTAALEALRAAVRLRPSYAGALRNLGALHYRLGQWDEAAAALQRAAAADPADADVRYWLGNVAVRLQAPGEAESHYRRAVALRPGFADAWCDLGNVLNDRGLREEAAQCLEKSLQANPAHAGAHLGMGNVLVGSGQLAQAAGWYRRALALDPHSVDARVNLGSALKDQGHWEEALQHYRAALALNPDAAETRWLIAMCHVPAIRDAGADLEKLREQFMAELVALERWFDEQRLADGWKAVGVAQPFMLAYQEASNRDLLQRYGRLCARLMQPWQAQHVPRPRAEASRVPVRVGVVSKYFRNHSVWNALMRGWFQHLDSGRFALQAFCLDPYEDAETRFARSRAARFEQGHAGLIQWAAAIVDAQPDVLIYPEIGMDPMTARLASMRLAPVQAASWGHPETTGLPTIDYYLSAAGFEPPDAQRHYTERLITLPDLGCCVQPDATVPAPPTAGRWGVEAGVPLLVCPGTPYKYAPEHDGLFVDIARRLGRCRLVFFTHWTPALSDRLRRRLEREFQAAGLEFARYVTFVPWLPRSEFLGLMGSADVMLDTIGFSGFNTALQAVECRLPVVTLQGRFLRGRLAAGILTRLGLQELVCASGEAYVGLAVRLAQDASYRDYVRQRIASGRHVLYQDSAPIRALEHFLQGAAGR